MSEETIPEIVIGGNKSFNDYLGIICQLGKYNDKIIIKYLDKHVDMAEILVNSLRKAFGWLQERDAEKSEDVNKKCIFFNDDIISAPGQLLRRGDKYGYCANKESGNLRCTFQVRQICPLYKQKDMTKILINRITIRKHGAIIGL